MRPALHHGAGRARRLLSSRTAARPRLHSLSVPTAEARQSTLAGTAAIAGTVPSPVVNSARLTSTPVVPLAPTPDAPLPPLEQYDALVSSGTLHPDLHQRRIIEHLQAFYVNLLSYKQPPVPPVSPSTAAPSLFSRIFTRSAPPPDQEGYPSNAPKGLYLHGDVGTGKTMLMDLFYRSLPCSIMRKRRVHFHAFMIDVHKRVHAAKIAMGPHEGGDPIAPVARDLASEAYVLCFDEFQVTDIADAMILRRLFEGLLGYGVVMVITSNRHPDELYKNGIQRSSFIPAIELLKSHFQVTNLDSGTDYRRIPRALSHVYYNPLTPENRAEIDTIFHSLTAPSSSSSSSSADPVITNRPLVTFGRTIHIPLSTSHVARFTFDELCARPLSAADYIEITRTFATIFVTDVPKLDVGRKDVNNEQGLPPEIVGASSMFTGEEEIFAFARACSRLVQMGSKEWAETSGTP
ncbi:hypothetical protein ID866_7615 [Astraeus odoratus]|nr:hypothetical protein ID866_7615 [Astraeus odoratus]